MNRSRITGDLVSQNNIFVDITNDRVGIGSTIPGQKLSLPDSAKIALGNSADLTLYHDGTNSYVNNTTGTLFYLANTHYFTNPAVSEIQATFVKDGAVELYHNGTKKFETNSEGIKISGDIRVGNASRINIKNDSGSETLARFNNNGAVELYHDNSLNFQTTNIGAQIDTSLVLYGAAGNPGKLRLQEGGAISEILVARNSDTNSFLYFRTEIGGTVATRMVIDESGHFRPFVDSAYDLGITGTRWRNVYADTLHATTLGSTLSYTSDTPRLQFTNSSFGTSLYIGGYTGNTNSTNISRIRTSTGNLHIDSASNGNVYLNQYSSGNVYVNGSIVLTRADEGSGNGIDADTLDGQEGSYYADAASYVKEIRTDDDITARMDSGFYETTSATTAEGWPETTNSHFHLISCTHSNTNNYHSLQIASPFTGQDNFYIRSSANSGTQAWSKIWTTSSDGSGSGLDADTVDGIQGANFLRSDTADTASGDITFSGGSGAITLAQSSDITFGTSGSWSGEKVKLQHHANNLYIQGGTSGINLRGSDGGTMAHFENTATTLYDPVTFNGNLTITSSDIRSHGTSNWTGNLGNDFGKIQMHSNRWYIVANGNSNRLLQLRQDGTDKSWFANDGQLYHGGSSTNDKYWRQGNDGSGSGLDADLLDGVQASSFLRSDATDTCSGQITFTNQIISAQDGDKSTQGGAALVLRHATTSAMRVNHFIHDDFPSGSATYYIQATEAGVSNDRNMCLQGYGGKVKIGGAGTEPTTTLDVQGTFKVSSTSTFSNDATFSGSAGAVTVASGSDIRIAGGAWTGEYTGGIKIQPDASNSYIQYHGGMYFRNSGGANRVYFDSAGNTTIVGNLTVNGAYSGNGSSLTSVNAATLANVSIASLLRSDADDTSSGTVAFGAGALDPDSFASFSGGFGGISDGSGWSARGVFVHGGGTGDAAAMAHNGNKLYFGIQNNASPNSMETWLDVTPASRVINFQTDNNNTNLQCGGNKIFHAGNDGSGSGLDADTLDGVQGANYVRTNQNTTITSDLFIGGGAGGVTVNAGSDIRFTSGNWTGNTTSPKIQAHSDYLYLVGGPNGIVFRENNTDRMIIDGSGHLRPGTNNDYDLGTSSIRWRNIYTNDLNLSNEGGANDVDGTWGNFTIQEGEDDLFLINKRNGKKYKFNLTEV